MRQAEKQARITEHLEEDAKASRRFLSVQVKIWRSLAIIHAHHPEIAKSSVIRMALDATLVGDIESLEAFEERAIAQAQSCGVTAGIYSPDASKPVCKGLTAKELYEP